MQEPIFPSIKRSLENLIEDEEGNIPAGKLLTIGTMVVLLANILSIEGFAAHGSHSSHSSHESHSSTSYIRHHTNHGSHSDHGSHTSHSNTASHSNSNYSAAGDYTTPTAPAASSIPTVDVSPYVLSADELSIPDLNPSTAATEATPATAVIPSLAVPLPTPQTDLPEANMETAPDTPKVFPDESADDS